MTRKDVRFNAKYIKNTANKRKDDKVQGEEIGNSTITGKHIADGAVTSEKLANGSVTTAKLVDDAVTYEKISAKAIKVYTTGGWTGSTSNREAPFADGMYNMWGYASAANTPATYTAGIGFGRGAGGSVEIAGSWTPGGLWTRWLRDCCQNWSGWASITIGSYSDRRRKADIKPIRNALETINQLEPVSYLEKHPDGSVGKIDPADIDLRKQNIREFGLIAQDAIHIIPEVVTHIKCNEPEQLDADWASAYEIDYAKLVPILISAIQEQQKSINDLNNKIKELNNVENPR